MTTTRRLGRLPLGVAAVADVALGVVAVLRAPFALHGPQFRALMVGPPIDHDSGARWPDLAIRTANAALRGLAGLPAARRFWRNTCLFRSVAACIVLRRRGVPARLQLGVRMAGDPSEPIQAHAWVELEGRVRVDVATWADYVPLAGRR